MKRRVTSLLFAVVTGSPVAVLVPTTEAGSIARALGSMPDQGKVAPTAKAITPRVLPSGAPACGNVLGKMSYANPDCTAIVIDQPEIGGGPAVLEDPKIPG